MFRICKSFEIESGHMLSKHPGLCRFPHGHSRRVDVVLSAHQLDAADMVCDFKTIKLALADFLKTFDHALAINSQDPLLPSLASVQDRLVIFSDTDPTTEVLALRIFQHLDREITDARAYTDSAGHRYQFPSGVRLERVRVTETTSTWAEFSRENR